MSLFGTAARTSASSTSTLKGECPQCWDHAHSRAAHRAWPPAGLPAVRGSHGQWLPWLQPALTAQIALMVERPGSTPAGALTFPPQTSAVSPKACARLRFFQSLPAGVSP